MKKLFFIFVSIFFVAILFASNKQKLMLAKIYHDGVNIQDYLVSEKLDGVRARWDGKNLISRGGKVFDAPAWFIANFPEEVLDGELWTKRNDFEQISSIARRANNDIAWKKVAFWIFDLPLKAVEFEKRVQEMEKIVSKTNSPYLKVIEQFSLTSNEELMKKFDEVIAKKGEGLMLHKKSAFYKKGRSNDLLKLKQYLDAEATVLGYKEGKGKYQGLVGSLKVQNDNGIVFFVGSGLSDEQRKKPPAIGSRITYRYQSLTKNQVPRFPAFLRIRVDG